MKKIQWFNRAAFGAMLCGILLVVQPVWHTGFRIGFFITLGATILAIVLSHLDREPEHHP